MQDANDERATTQGPTKLLMRISHSTCQSGSHSDVLRIELAKEICTHGEHDDFRSMVTLIEQIAGSLGQV